MTNAVRTLVLNRGAGYFDGVDGVTYIDPGFRPLDLSQKYVDLRADVFSAVSGPKAESERADAVMSVLHCPELEADVLAFDTRITYDVGTRSPEPVIAGSVAGPDVLGLCERSRSVYSDVFDGDDVFTARMRRIWSVAFEPRLVFGAFVLAYARKLATTGDRL